MEASNAGHYPAGASVPDELRGVPAPRRSKGVEPMGRGRAKAKQTKVARRLKYTTTGTDLDRLRAELSSDSPVDQDEGPGGGDAGEVEDDYEDPYADYLGDDEGDEEEGEEGDARGR